jgi:hypothetical protein
MDRGFECFTEKVWRQSRKLPIIPSPFHIDDVVQVRERKARHRNGIWQFIAQRETTSPTARMLLASAEHSQRKAFSVMPTGCCCLARQPLR